MTNDDTEDKAGVISAGVSASAKYQITKSVTQNIPDDVTRARSGAWLDLISPITEWAGLKGDELRHKRDLLRIEQEETLYLVGDKAQQRLKELQVDTKPVPTKALIPILEKASLEAPDSILIEVWGNLLASASADYDVEVITFSEILSKIGPREAAIINEMIKFSDLKQWADRQNRATAGTGFEVYDKEIDIKLLILKALDESDQSIFERLLEYFPTAYPLLVTKIQKGIATERANKIDTIFESEFFAANAPGFEILEKQGLIKGCYAGYSWLRNSDDGPSGFSWYELTQLGFAFLQRIAVVSSKSTEAK